MKNIFQEIKKDLPEELIETIFNTDDIKIERIVSRGHSSPKNFWYDQDKNEFVMLLNGEAKLLFEDNKEITLKPGDYLTIPLHTKHRIEWTSPDEDTIWLTVFYGKNYAMKK